MGTSPRKQPKPDAVSKEASLAGLAGRIGELVEAESDRGAILILGAYLDEILGLLIAAACIGDASADNLLKHGQPAGTFEGRLVLAHALGLIHEEDVKCLRIVQKIRNKASHFDRSGRGFDVLFDSPATADQVVELGSLLYEKPTDRSPAAIRRSFVDSARNTATRLLLRRSDIQRPTPPKSTAELVGEALSLNVADFPLGDFVEQIRRLKDSTEGQAQYQTMVHFLSKVFVNSHASPDGVGLPDEMMPAVADFLSRAGALDLDILRRDEPTEH